MSTPHAERKAAAYKSSRDSGEFAAPTASVAGPAVKGTAPLVREKGEQWRHSREFVSETLEAEFTSALAVETFSLFKRMLLFVVLIALFGIFCDLARFSDTSQRQLSVRILVAAVSIVLVVLLGVFLRRPTLPARGGATAAGNTVDAATARGPGTPGGSTTSGAPSASSQQLPASLLCVLVGCAWTVSVLLYTSDSSSGAVIAFLVTLQLFGKMLLFPNLCVVSWLVTLCYVILAGALHGDSGGVRLALEIGYLVLANIVLTLASHHYEALRRLAFVYRCGLSCARAI